MSAGVADPPGMGPPPERDGTMISTRTCSTSSGLEDPIRLLLCAVVAALGLWLAAADSATAGPRKPAEVSTAAQLENAWENPRTRAIELHRDIALRACRSGEPIRESARPLKLDGNGHELRQTCFERRLLRQDGTGFVVLENITLTRGGSDGPGAAVTTRGEIVLKNARVTQNLAEEPGGGIFSQRRATVVDSVIVGNLANDDGGGVYARRGGIQVFDSVVSSNLVDGSGGALGSTGDILVVRSHIDGNTTDGDGGAIYTDEDGDVTVIDSTVDGSTADGPGGAIFTLDGDVTIVGSRLNGNRADDRGGAISAEADLTVINSTIAGNAAVAHVGGGIWSRDDTFMSNSTIASNYAEGQGGGILAAGSLGLVNSTVIDNTASVAANIGVGEDLRAFGSIIGPANTTPGGGQVRPTEINCQLSSATSFGFNVVSDDSCELDHPSDVIGEGDPLLGPLALNGGIGQSRMPLPDSPVVDLIPADDCGFEPFGYDLEGEQHLGQFGIDPLSRIAGDQRGVDRPQGGGCDAGAIEVEAGETPAAQSAPAPDLPEADPDVAAGARRASNEPSAAPTSARLSSRALNGRSVRGQVARIGRMVKVMERIAKRFRRFKACTSPVRVSEYGDQDHRFGYVYDERDGTGRDRRPALAVDRGRRGRSDYRFLDFALRRRCRSETTHYGTAENPGTADPASASQAAGRPPRRTAKGQGLKARLDELERRAERLDRMSERFDEWESCLSWVPVTEYGDPDGGFGFLFGRRGATPDYRPALAVDRSPWDDPDYMLLAFVGRDRPFGRRECGNEPGESVDKRKRRRHPGPRSKVAVVQAASGGARRAKSDDALEDLRQDADALLRTVSDLGEPVEEFATFDQCAYTLGVTQYGKGPKRKASKKAGYVYGKRRRAAFAIDIRGFDRARYQFLAFPGEEPPSIECNEDAGGLFTN
jgi:hypothetical protein